MSRHVSRPSKSMVQPFNGVHLEPLELVRVGTFMDGVISTTRIKAQAIGPKGGFIVRSGLRRIG
ncbi:MAG: hypothetical protein LKI34_03020 [Bifidobacterium tibiigranuli]|uniref:hypothetical protein n=1 Tax=Bifidobacterium tibiigranuli TaxID=2172043 RepID=UPI0026ED6CC5|nr:hypothetical protein [Bifidobacterium tibiigranuli]MCI1673179.1 hypothetical protein [Bifidobacterium tibiigranuli]MCI1713576.1 hypothetical protein [Bifidobacterium tibiigranuli]